MLVTTALLFENCYGRYAIPAINIWCMEQLHALFSAAEKTKSPFIVQMTPVALDYGKRKMLIAMISAAAELYENTQFAIHLDHGTPETALEAIDSGQFSSVMIDASHENYEKNVEITRRIVEHAHKNDVQVEAELGVLSGVEDDKIIGEKESKYTRPAEVEDFVNKTGCDSLAVAVGTSHGAYKFPGKQGIQFEILKEIQARLPGYPLVLHGGSSIDINEVNRINSAGGKLGKGASGVPVEEINKATKYGICKVNIATDARILWTRVHREFFKDSPEAFDPVIPGRTYMEELEKLYTEKFRLFNAKGKMEDLINDETR